MLDFVNRQRQVPLPPLSEAGQIEHLRMTRSGLRLRGATCSLALGGTTLLATGRVEAGVVTSALTSAIFGIHALMRAKEIIDTKQYDELTEMEPLDQLPTETDTDE